MKVIEALGYAQYLKVLRDNERCGFFIAKPGKIYQINAANIRVLPQIIHDLAILHPVQNYPMWVDHGAEALDDVWMF